MKTNPYDAAFIRTTGSIATPTDGLTKLEYFSVLIMQGIISTRDQFPTPLYIPEESVRLAKVLIDELNKQDEENKNAINQTNS